MTDTFALSRRSAMAAAGAAGLGVALAGSPLRANSRFLPMTAVMSVIQAWNRHDVEAVVSHVTDDIVYHATSGYRPAASGKAAFKALLQQMGPVIQTSNWRLFDYAENGNRLFVEGVDDFITTAGHHVVIPYAGVFEFRGALITNWREYYDGRISAEMKAGAPLTDEIRSLINRPAI